MGKSVMDSESLSFTGQKNQNAVDPQLKPMGISRRRINVPGSCLKVYCV